MSLKDKWAFTLGTEVGKALANIKPVQAIERDDDLENMAAFLVGLRQSSVTACLILTNDRLTDIALCLPAEPREAMLAVIGRALVK